MQSPPSSHQNAFANQMTDLNMWSANSAHGRTARFSLWSQIAVEMVDWKIRSRTWVVKSRFLADYYIFLHTCELHCITALTQHRNIVPATSFFSSFHSVFSFSLVFFAWRSTVRQIETLLSDEINCCEKPYRFHCTRLFKFKHNIGLCVSSTIAHFCFETVKAFAYE